MNKLGFIRAQSDAGIFIHQSKDNQLIIACIYVDDAIFCSSNKDLVRLKKQQFMDAWENRDLGEAKEFLQMTITRSGTSIALDQKKYLQKIIKQFELENA